MGSLSTAFSAEMTAILRCTELLLTKNLMNRIHIWSDSRAALAVLTKTTTKSSLVWKCMQVLGKLSELNKVTLACIPRHQGVPGSKEADRLAKKVAIKVPT
jgi:ribonuclease HI